MATTDEEDAMQILRGATTKLTLLLAFVRAKIWIKTKDIKALRWCWLFALITGLMHIERLALDVQRSIKLLGGLQAES